MDSSKQDFEVGRKLAEVLIEVASYRVGAKGQKRQDGANQEPALARGGAPSSVSVTDTAVYAVKRQARRMRMRDVVNITLDGHASFLIDLSTRGAQVLAPASLRPKQEVHIALVIGDRAIQCAGKVVWRCSSRRKARPERCIERAWSLLKSTRPASRRFSRRWACSTASTCCADRVWSVRGQARLRRSFSACRASASLRRLEMPACSRTALSRASA